MKFLILIVIWALPLILVLAFLGFSEGSEKAFIGLSFLNSILATVLLYAPPRTLEYLRIRGRKFQIYRSHAEPSLSKPMVLFITSNGAGLGHLTRVSAISDQLKSVDFRIITLSSAYRKVNISPSEIYYFPSYRDVEMEASAWNSAFSKYLEAMDSIFEPSLVVFDGTHIYQGITNIFHEKRIPIWWIQRGCWKPEVEKNTNQRRNSGLYCQRVVIPGDFGCDETPQLGKDVEVKRVNPIVKKPSGEIPSKQEAFLALGFDSRKKYVLIQLGAGKINNIKSVREMAITLVHELGPEWVPVVTNNPLNPDSFSTKVKVIEAYPISRYFSAFEFSVFAAGYNSVQESIEFKLPAVFIPNENTSTDDQVRRAKGIELNNLGLYAQSPSGLRVAISKLSDPLMRGAIIEEHERCELANGAMIVAADIEAQLKVLKQKA